jgi:hypothetical protein
MEPINKPDKIADDLKAHLSELKIQCVGETPIEVCQFGTKFCM